MYLLKNLFITSSILLVKLTLIDGTNTSTVCFGSNGISCTTHRLSCTSSLVIQIINAIYGYRPGCNDVNGLSQCGNITCCNEAPDDCFILFSSDEHQQVLGNCSGVETCEVQGLRRYNTTHTVCNGRIASAYSKVEYDCVSKGSSIITSYYSIDSGTSTISLADKTTYISTETTFIHSNSKPTTTKSFISSTFSITSTAKGQDVIESSNVGSIVGGIFGVIIIFIIIVVVVFLYKRRKGSPAPPSIDKKTLTQTGTPHYHVIDGPGTINGSKDTSGYDEIELDNIPKVQATSAHLKKVKVKTKELDNYNHVETHEHSVHEDNYNHIGNNPSVSSNHLEADYNHINGVFETDEDEYNHIGNNDNNHVITDDNYHHIGSGDIKVEGDYDHI